MRAPLVLVAMNIVYSVAARPPAGALSDHARPQSLLFSGLVALFAADSALALGVGRIHRHRPVGGAHAAHAGTARQARRRSRPDELRGSGFGIGRAPAQGV